MKAARVALLLAAVFALAAAIAGGLARLGVVAPLGSTALNHAALMISGFLGTVIALERAVALGKGWAYGAPLSAGAGAIALAFGFDAAARILWIAAPLLFIAASVEIVRRQAMLHTVLLLVAAMCWAAGNLFFLYSTSLAAISPWFAFLVLTIAAERLELTRLARRGPAARPTFIAAAALLLAGAFFSQLAFGAGLVALAAWLAVFDVARRTVRAAGFARYSAIALIAGYAWLAAAGIAWMLAHAELPVPRDFALHALGLGFVFSMILAHAPLVVPVIARVPMRFTPAFYAPLALLHASVAVRLFGGATDFAVRGAGGILNTAALALFAATVAYSLARPSPRATAARFAGS